MELEHIRISKPGHEDEETESPSRTEEVILLSCAFTRRALPFRVERTRRIDQKTKKRHPSLPDNLFLAVMTDAGHLLSDVAGLGVSLLAIKVSSWEANPRNSSGFKRLKVLAAFLSVQLVFYIKYPRVRNRDDPWVTVTRLNPRGRVQGSSELEDPLQPSTSGNLSAAEDFAGVGLVVDLTDFGEEAVVHVEDEPVIGEFHQDPDSDSSGDDDYH
ncbi:hypothetical protein YC2023_050391 [Brassica napus]